MSEQAGSAGVERAEFEAWCRSKGIPNRIERELLYEVWQAARSSQAKQEGPTREGLAKLKAELAGICTFIDGAIIGKPVTIDSYRDALTVAHNLSALCAELLGEGSGK